MRKSILFVMALAVTALLAVSCQKEGQFNPAKKVKIISKTISGTTSFGQEISETQTREFQWDGNSLLAVNCYVNGEISEISKYTYDSKKRFSQISHFRTSSNQEAIYKYSYDGNKLSSIKLSVDNVEYGTWVVEHSGNVISQISYKPTSAKASSTFAPTADAFFFLPDNIIEDLNLAFKKNNAKGFGTSTIMFSWENGNLVGYSYSVNSYSYNVKLGYDANKNPLYGWYDSDCNSVDEMLSKHNITSESKEIKGETQTTTINTTFTYTYTGSFPSTCTWTTDVEYAGEIVKATCKQTFEY